tara:strand:- start:194 stop:793 length:600 start_codon:yes stop_codon:yes gene_type:complete
MARMNRQKVFRALMELVSDVGWSNFTLAALARNQEIEELELESLFSDKVGLLQAFSEFIDEQTLANLDSDIFDPEIPIRERLLEIMLVRFDVLAPYKDGVCELLKVTGKDPKMFVVAAKAIKISMRSSLETVGVSTRGIKGNIKIKGLAVVFLFGMRTWSKEEGRDITATTRILDDRLKWAESLATSLGMVEENSGHDL